MALYHKNFKYHEDTVEKHEITEDEIQFLIKLQREMNTQDTVGQADPRFWVIRGIEREYGIENGYEDGIELRNECEDTVAESFTEAIEYINENIIPEINEENDKEMSLCIEEGLYCYKRALLTWKEDGEEMTTQFDDMEEIIEWLKEYGYSYRAVNYREKEVNYPDTMFLTQKSAEEHLKNNDYHYSSDAHTYAMTAWRTPEVSMLYKILQTVDFSKFMEDK